MISTFTVYLRLGFEHLLDLQGYDHILFLAVLCAAYSLARWRELLVLVTAFTIGHSVSLVVATLRLVRVDTGLIEFLIPVTIVATAVTSLDGLRRQDPSGHRVAARPLRYALALIFGVIHGLGFSNLLRLALGGERSLLVPLLSFNIGLELAQIVVVAGVLVVALVAVRLLSLPQSLWTLMLSVLAGSVGVLMAVERWPY